MKGENRVMPLDSCRTSKTIFRTQQPKDTVTTIEDSTEEGLLSASHYDLGGLNT